MSKNIEVIDTDSPVIAVDFDGVIVEDGAYPDIGELKKNSIESMKFLKHNGYRIVIWTCRDTEKQKKKVKEFLDKNDIPYDAFNDNSALTEEELEKVGNNLSRKIGCSLFLDDKAVRFIDWSSALLEILIRTKGEELTIDNINMNGELILEDN